MELLIPNRILNDDTYKLYVAYATEKKELSVVKCDGSIRYCDSNPQGKRLRCKLCQYRVNKIAELAGNSIDFSSKNILGVIEKSPLWLDGIHFINTTVSELLGEKYRKKHFTKKEKNNVIIANDILLSRNFFEIKKNKLVGIYIENLADVLRRNNFSKQNINGNFKA